MIVENEITLAEAIERARNRGVISGGSFEWFRKQAAKSGRVHIAEGTVIAFKRGRRWMVAEPQLEEAIVRAEGHKNAKNESERQAGEDYVARILNPKGARTSWGGYRVHGDFHFVWSDYERMRQRSDGGWTCNRCWKAAGTEHKKPECHTCSDWNGCGTDCTLSRIYCADCGTSMGA